MYKLKRSISLLYISVISYNMGYPSYNWTRTERFELKIYRVNELKIYRVNDSLSVWSRCCENLKSGHFTLLFCEKGKKCIRMHAAPLFCLF